MTRQEYREYMTSLVEQGHDWFNHETGRANIVAANTDHKPRDIKDILEDYKQWSIKPRQIDRE